MDPFATNLTYLPDSDQLMHSGEGSSEGGEKSCKGEEINPNRSEKKYKGIRQRKWGKWVSEVRLPRTRHRLWLGSYSTPEAAAVARDTAVFYLRGPSSIGDLNFPMCIPNSHLPDMSPLSIQKAATDAGMTVDAELATKLPENDVKLPESGVFESAERPVWESEDDYAKVYGGSEMREGEALSISIDDMEIYM